MTIRKITAGDGYVYLTRQVANGDTGPAPELDATGYYTAAGYPPGQWLGRGAPLLGVAGQQVSEEQMRALFGYGQHPDADAIITAHIRTRIRPGMTRRQLDELEADAIRAATLGRPFPEYQPLGDYDVRVGKRLGIIREGTGRDPTEAEIKKVQSEEARRQRAAVAGFDLVFSPVKSAALLWAIDDRPHVRDAIRQAHQQAITQALDLVEDHAAWTRAGTGGVAQLATNGLTAAAFEHWDSRAGDPNLHTHVAVSAKVQGSDGKWRSLDARALYRIAVAASECYNTAFETALTALLPGVSFTARPDTIGGKEAVREISHIPFGYIEHFSRRRRELEARYSQLVRAYRARHGREPDAAACHKLAQQACLDTRPGKKPPQTLAAKRAAWRDELTTQFGPGAVAAVMSAVPDGAVPQVPAAPPDLGFLAERTVCHVSRQRSTWTVWNLRAEAERLLREHARFATLAGHRQAAEEVTARAAELSVCCEPPALLTEPAGLRRPGGESVFGDHGAARYTSRAVLDAERRLLEATTATVAAGPPALSAAAAIDGYEAQTGTRLDAGQRHLVTTFAASGRLLLAGIGPAGAGKTTAMRALTRVLGQHRRRLVPLATSAAAADVLGRELGVPAENLHKFLHEWDRGPFAARLRAGEPVPHHARFWALAPGDVILVDEAGMAGTFLLDQLVTVAASRGAVVRLLGDDRQLGAVESGGALRLIAAQPGTPELSVLYRFRDPAEAAATLQIRTGEPAAVGWYHATGRIRSGSRDAMTQAAYHGWKADMLAGKVSLMAAGKGVDVTALAGQARADRVAAGHVEPGGVTLADGNLAGRGDWIVTRSNKRTLVMHGGRDWVKNGDAWQVVRRHPDGSLSCAHLGHRGHVRLPAAYVRDSVELLYATTAHRAEGTTVDTAHPLVTAGMTREMLYVLASRARDKTTLYVATHDVLPADEDERVDRVRWDRRSYAAREILCNILATEGSELSATQTIQTLQDQAASLATLVPRYLHAACQLADARYRDAALLVFGERDGGALAADHAWGALVRRLYDAETGGWQPARLLAAVARQRELDTADSVAEVLCWRIDGYLPDRVPPALLERPEPADAERYAQLIAAHPGFRDEQFDAGQAVAVPSALTPRRNVIHERDPGASRHAGPRDTLTAVTGSALSLRAQAEPAWPALEAALRRAERGGHDAAAVLGIVARGRELRTARTISQTLAWRIGRYLACYPEPVLPHTVAPGRPADPGTWQTLTWTLKAAENNGTPAETIITAARHARHLGDLIAAARHAALPQAAGPGDDELPWLRHPGLPGHDGGDAELARYLSEATTLIRTRTQSLADTAARDRPAWMSLLGQPPGHAQRRGQWLHHIGVIAAYRDQHQITTSDPHQVLGPYPEPGRAGHAAYRFAAESTLEARRLAGLEPAANREPDPVSAQVAADIYRALPDAERARLAAIITGRLGPLRFDPAEPDDAVAHPGFARHLIEALTEHGHLTRTLPQAAGVRPVEADLAQRTATRRHTPARHPAHSSPANDRQYRADIAAADARAELRRPAEGPRQQQATASPS